MLFMKATHSFEVFPMTTRQMIDAGWKNAKKALLKMDAATRRYDLSAGHRVAMDCFLAIGLDAKIAQEVGFECYMCFRTR
jgi:hypothetical protein